jgi:hypothetical protein
VDDLGGRVGVDGVEEDVAGVQVVARGDLDGLLGERAVGDEHHLIAERPQLDGAPRDALDHARPRADRDHVAHVEGLVGLQRDAREEVAERVLEGEADDDAEQGGAGEQRAEREGGELDFEDQRGQHHVGDEREDVADEVRGGAALADAEYDVEEERAREPDEEEHRAQREREFHARLDQAVGRVAPPVVAQLRFGERAEFGLGERRRRERAQEVEREREEGERGEREDELSGESLASHKSERG